MRRGGRRALRAAHLSYNASEPRMCRRLHLVPPSGRVEEGLQRGACLCRTKERRVLHPRELQEGAISTVPAGLERGAKHRPRAHLNRRVVHALDHKQLRPLAGRKALRDRTTRPKRSAAPTEMEAFEKLRL